MAKSSISPTTLIALGGAGVLAYFLFKPSPQGSTTPVGSTISSVGSSVNDILSGFASNINATGNALYGTATGLANIETGLGNTLTGAGNFTYGTGAGIGSALYGAGSGVGNLFTGFGNFTGSTLTGAGNFTGSTLTGAGNLATGVGNTFTGFGNTLTGGGNLFEGFFSPINSVSNAVASIFGGGSKSSGVSQPFGMTGGATQSLGTPAKAGVSPTSAIDLTFGSTPLNKLEVQKSFSGGSSGASYPRSVAPQSKALPQSSAPVQYSYFSGIGGGTSRYSSQFGYQSVAGF